MKTVFYILGQLRDEDVAWLSENGQIVEYDTGACIIEEDKKVQALSIILAGEVSISTDKSGVFKTLGVGEIVGEMAVVESRPATATVVTTKDSTFLQIDLSILLDKLNSDADFAAGLYRAFSTFLSHRLRQAVVLLDDSHFWDSSMDEKEVNDSEPMEPAFVETFLIASQRFDTVLQLLSHQGH